MSAVITITLPYPPTINQYWRRVGGRTLLSAKARAYKDAVLVCCQQARISRKRLRGNLAVHVQAYMPDRRKRDLDNILKPLLDALMYARVYEDDSQIRWLLIERKPFVKKTKGSVAVRIKECDDEE